MNIGKKWFWIGFIFLVPGWVLCQRDPRADKVVQMVQKTLTKTNDLTAQFRYVVLNRAVKGSKPITQNGKLYMKKGNKYRIILPDQEVYCDGKTVWIYLKDDQEVNINHYDPEEGFSVDRLFQIYQRNMKARYDGIEMVDGKRAEKITFFPESDETEYFKIVSWVDIKTHLPVKTEIWGRNGTVVTYTLLSTQIDTGLDDGLFVFRQSDHPGVEVIDMR